MQNSLLTAQLDLAPGSRKGGFVSAIPKADRSVVDRHGNDKATGGDRLIERIRRKPID